MKRHTRILAALVAGGLSAGAASLARAQGQTQERPCMADAARLCPDVEPGGGAQVTCLKQHVQELSPACKRNVMKMKIKHEEQKQLEQQQQQGMPQQP